MAQVPKVYVPTPAQAGAAARAMRPTNIASLDSQINESSAGQPTSSLDTAPFTLEGGRQRDPGQGRDNNQPQPWPRHGGLIAVNSQTFGSLVEYYGSTVANDAGPEVRGRQFGGVISRAINTYETNAKIIHGEPDVTGKELSLRL